MPTTQQLPVKQLSLDVRNFRTVPQSSETAAIHALMAVDTDWFWALMESLLDTGYLPTENIIILKSGKKQIVKEGNRRIAALKLMLGHATPSDFPLPAEIAEKIGQLSDAWKKANANVPCAIYETHEEDAANRIVTLTHGKGEKAGRARWNAVARARHNRDKNKGSEPGLDLMEKYLEHGKNLNGNQKERWAGDYPITVLDEAIKRLAPRLGFKSSPELAEAYPKLKKGKQGLDTMLLDIGLSDLSFKEIRHGSIDFGTKYGFPPPADPTTNTSTSTSSNTSGSGGNAGGSQGSGGAKTSAGASTTATTKSAKAYAINDPKAVAAALKAFRPKGKNREKIVTLLDEIRRLKIADHPHAFCFLLRSMFEISAKAYCVDHKNSGGPTTTKPKTGEDRPLVEVLRDIVNHLTKQKADKAMVKVLHGAMTQLGKQDSLLSVTSFNQLVHNPKFVIAPSDICGLFGNIFPLLEEMNK